MLPEMPGVKVDLEVVLVLDLQPQLSQNKPNDHIGFNHDKKK